MKTRLPVQLAALFLLAVAPVGAQTTQEVRTNDPIIRSAMTRLQLAENDYEKARATCAELESVLRERTGRVDVSQKGLEGYANQLQSELDLLTLQEIGSHARSRALEDAVAEQMAVAEKRSRDDSVVEELQKLAEAREKQLQFVEQEHKNGVGTASALQDAIAALADARAKVAERRQTVVSNAGGDIVSSLKRELLNLNIDTHERQAKMEFLQKELARIKPGLEQSRELDLQEQMLSAESKMVQMSRHDLEAVEAHAGYSRDQLTAPAKGQ